jgi:hypothetical protein
MSLRVSHISNLESAKYAPGDLVRYEKITYTVTAATHAHVQLAGLEKAVPAWLVRPVKRRTK